MELQILQVLWYLSLQFGLNELMLMAYIVSSWVIIADNINIIKLKFTHLLTIISVLSNNIELCSAYGLDLFKQIEPNSLLA